MSFQFFFTRARLSVSNLDTFLFIGFHHPLLTIKDFPGSKDLAVPASQSEGGVRMDTAHRLRVGDFRILFTRDGHIIEVSKIDNRGQVYR
mgnify:CR=1 FL=1